MPWVQTISRYIKLRAARFATLMHIEKTCFILEIKSKPADQGFVGLGQGPELSADALIAGCALPSHLLCPPHKDSPIAAD